MAFPDPAAGLSYDGVAKTLARISSTGNQSVYQSSDGSFKFTISHQFTGKEGTMSRRVSTMVKLSMRAIVTNPLDAEDSSYQLLNTYIVIDRQETSFTVDQVDDLRAMLTTWLTTANVTKLYGLET